MKVINRINELKQELRQLRSERNNGTVGFIPTMGYLHAGHFSLVTEAQQQTDIVVMSIFVNPLQFGPNEDFDKYPRDHERDLRMAREAGVDIVFLPETAEMYPKPIKTTVSVAGITEQLCGASRPGHFDGVATVVTKLFNVVQPDKAFFGTKDAQQVAVIAQMVQDLNMNVTIVPCPTLREPDGLAMSSRNVYLTEEQRKQAVVLSEALKQAERQIREGELTWQEIKKQAIEHISTAPLARIDYVELLAYPSLQPVESEVTGSPHSIVLALAVKFGHTRLIDNLIMEAGR
jgi:pantoate--beta-alanine ligase